jgi:hypothetical protein
VIKSELLIRRQTGAPDVDGYEVVSALEQAAAIGFVNAIEPVETEAPSDGFAIRRSKRLIGAGFVESLGAEFVMRQDYVAPVRPVSGFNL